MVSPIIEPTDGWTPLEKTLLRTVVVQMYRRLTDPVDKFVIMASFESGYSQTDISQMIGISQSAICKRIDKAVKYVRGSNLL